MNVLGRETAPCGRNNITWMQKTGVMSPQPKQGRGSPANQQRLEEGRRESSLQVSEGAGPCQHLDFGSSQPPGLRQCDFIVLSHPGHGASLQQPQEANSVTIPDHGETPEPESGLQSQIASIQPLPSRMILSKHWPHLSEPWFPHL